MKRTYNLVKNVGTTILTEQVGYVIFYVTAYCNLLCKHCFYIDHIKTARERKELTTDEYRQISNNLGKLTNVNFTGGEPFLRKDLAEIIGHMAKQNQPSFFGVTTNGLLTKRIVDTVEKILAECRTSYLKIGVSLDGIREVHDDIRQHNGSFTQAVKTIEALASLRAKYKNLFIYVSTTLTRSNAPTIKQMIDEISALPVDAHYLGYIRGEPQDETENDVSLEAYREVSAYLDRKWESRRDVFGFLNILNSTVRKVNAEILENNSYLFPCVAGRKMLTFSEDGKVLPCEILDQKNEGGFTMGDIREFNYDVNKLLSSPKARSISDWITQEKCRCTFECANQASLAYQPLSFIKTITKLRKQN